MYKTLFSVFLGSALLLSGEVSFSEASASGYNNRSYSKGYTRSHRHYRRGHNGYRKRDRRNRGSFVIINQTHVEPLPAKSLELSPVSRVMKVSRNQTKVGQARAEARGDTFGKKGWVVVSRSSNEKKSTREEFIKRIVVAKAPSAYKAPAKIRRIKKRAKPAISVAAPKLRARDPEVIYFDD